MTKPRPKWQTTLLIGLRVHFKSYPDVHTFLHTIKDGDVGAVLRDIVRAHIQQTGHRAGDPNYQKEVAMLGMSNLLDDTIAAAKTSDSTPRPATARTDKIQTRVAAQAVETQSATPPAPVPVPAASSHRGFAGAPAGPDLTGVQEPPTPPIEEPAAAPAGKPPGILSRFDDD
ncbi:hypothetical protein LMG22037_06158 [Paraburkholderia phenoliruptrix]|jgi:hypothetical protein|uniref:Uncharacterized protein n=1 Tax=Paraburkholderia phenoliruptrix TaxID=252970 RepID=A0A6J5CKI6_9BURK|nr:hypothetical protein LMG22037_06158 [Paraburkholderia phenoliruptrix]